MNTPFTINIRAVKRVAYAMAAALIFIAGLPLLRPGLAGATPAQLSSRSIKLSDSGFSGGTITSGIGSGTAVTYEVGFTATHAAGSLVIDFCSEDPIINDTCTTPVGMSAAGAGLTAVSGNVSAANNWSFGSTSAGQIKLNDDDGTGGAHDIAAGAQVFDLTGITNPSSANCSTGVACTFYARIYTFTNNSYGSYSSPTAVNLGTNSDYGGIALSTTSTITITARVQETLTFCVTKALPSTWTTTNDCSDPVITSCPSPPTTCNLPAVTLGHGSPTPILEPNAIDTSNGPYTGGSVQPGGGDVYTQLSTNATSGAIIRMHSNGGKTTGTPTCGGLSADGGTTCAIPAHNAAGGAATGMTAGTAAFGLFVANSTLAPNGVGSLTPSTTYHDAAHTTIPDSTPTAGDLFFGMDSTTSGNNVISTFGSTVLSTGSPTYRVDNRYVFAATASLTTPAGIYTANLSLIATGTF